MTTDHAGAEEAAKELFFTTEGRTNPYPLYHRLRDADPIHRFGIGWLLTRYDDCWGVLRDPRFGKDFERQMTNKFGAGWEKHPSLKYQEKVLFNVGGAEHTRLRKAVSKSFTPRMVGKLREHIDETVRALIGPFAEGGGGNILDAVGFPLPVTIIGEMVGVPESEREQFRPLISDIVEVFEMAVGEEQLAAADKAQVVMLDYFLDLIERKRSKPGEDLLSGLIQADVDGDALSDFDIAMMSQTLFTAGFETTTNLFGNSLYALLSHPGQIEKLRAEPDLFATLPDEFLRFDGPIQLNSRMAKTDVEVGGVTIPEGDQVFTVVGAGNHDPAMFDEPDRLDVTRTDGRPLTLGGGAHFCLGASLARLETEVTFRALLSMMDSIELAATPQYYDRFAVRSLESLHVTCVPAQRADQATVAVPAAIPEMPPTGRPPLAHDRGFRPSGDADADLRWRAQMRERIESEPGMSGSLPQRTGKELSETVALFARNSLFKQCTVDQLEQLAATAYKISFEAGDQICSEGAESPEAYMIEEGRALVTIDRKGAGAVHEDDIVGERGILLEAPRAATVTATSHLIAYAISRERFRYLVDHNPGVRDHMIAEMGRRYPEAR